MAETKTPTPTVLPGIPEPDRIQDTECMVTNPHASRSPHGRQARDQKDTSQQEAVQFDELTSLAQIPAYVNIWDNNEW